MRLLALVCFLVACTKPNPAATCPNGFCLDPEFGFCDVDGAISGMPETCIAVNCVPETFAGCRDDQAITCNATGDGFDLIACPFGCGESGCRACVTGETACVDDDLVRCTSDGEFAAESCPVGCIDGASAHCAYLEPQFIPDACDSIATESLVVSSSGILDTDLDLNCNGGIVDQGEAQSDICVLRYSSITIEAGATLGFNGLRLVALVADESLRIDGVLDVSAVGNTHGPGVRVRSGDGGTLTAANGGAGFQTAGGNGGSTTANGAGTAGGLAEPNPIGLVSLVAGRHSGKPGGGGGGATLISCRGSVVVDGIVAANGGGGRSAASFGNVVNGCGGGGSGGFVAIQGLQIMFTGEAYANGGGGGSGKPSNQSTGLAGQDGQRSAAVAAFGGPAVSDEGAGGNGAVGSSPGAAGLRSNNANATPGCGGGGLGWFQTLTPEGVVPTITPRAASPTFENNRSVQKR